MINQQVARLMKVEKSTTRRGSPDPKSLLEDVHIMILRIRTAALFNIKPKRRGNNKKRPFQSGSNTLSDNGVAGHFHFGCALRTPITTSRARDGSILASAEIAGLQTENQKKIQAGSIEKVGIFFRYSNP